MILQKTTDVSTLGNFLKKQVLTIKKLFLPLPNNMHSCNITKVFGRTINEKFLPPILKQL